MSKNNEPLNYFKDAMPATYNWCWPRSTRCRQLCECPQCEFFLSALEEAGEFEFKREYPQTWPAEDAKGYTHTRAYRRWKDKVHLKRKLKIANIRDFRVKHNGMLVKGKVHCSCKMCQEIKKQGTRKSLLYNKKHKKRNKRY